VDGDERFDVAEVGEQPDVGNDVVTDGPLGDASIGDVEASFHGVAARPNA
jgi:hypothetical protein